MILKKNILLCKSSDIIFFIQIDLVLSNVLFFIKRMINCSFKIHDLFIFKHFTEIKSEHIPSKNNIQ